MAHHKSGKSGTHKYGRNAKKCELYKSKGRGENNKARRLAARERKFERNRQRRTNGKN
jgi:hypothetical protein